ncbi:uncharacterized protein LOC132286360 [Cornus florida]|uniref:uncharacterized protein LOC132286360 n=1 Tax=Cornus florida TaxID=4283 RepID=UPI00289B1ED0|nr:uncharacterized protein LOC132286360 [Cornus florida]
MSLVTEEIKANAEVYYGDEICQEKTKLLLKEVGLPNGLLPLENIVECGYVKDTGFVWLKQKKKTEHKFDKVGRLVSFATDITAYADPNKIKKLTGVKTKELFLWITVSDIHNDDPPTTKINFKTPTGISRSFPVSAFEVEEAKEVKESNGVTNGVKEVKKSNGVTNGVNGGVKEMKKSNGVTNGVKEV